MTPKLIAGPAAALLLIILPVQARAADNAVQGITLGQESPDQWRASKLVGVQIYGPDNKSVGKITDLLMNHDGGAQDVIVGVGGFLGIGEKDVAIPYAAVNFSSTPLSAATGAPNNNLATVPAAPGAMAPAAGTAPDAGLPANPVGLGTPATTTMPMTPAETKAIMQPSTAYPDHGVIAFTADQLKSAPAFKFAR